MINGHAQPIETALFPAGSWEEGKKYRYNTEVMTALLREQVPVLDYVKWKVLEIEQGRSRTMLPLISPSTNQHCTHQAALLFLAADYTGGIALGSLFPGVPLVGVHPVAPLDKSMSLWLVKGEIKFFRPSAGCMEAHAEVDVERRAKVQKRYALGKPIVETITVHFQNGDVEVAQAEMTYYARQSEKLRSDGMEPEKVNILYQHKLISSAELIAGVRARMTGTLFNDPYANRIAGEHGLALASRFCEKTPQLGGMVAARTRHLDLQIQEFARNGGRNLVLLGSGYDMRPFRLDLPAGMTVYELDFPTVLKDRQCRIDGFGAKDPAGVRRIPVPVDLRTIAVSECMKDVLDFSTPTFIAWEGMSMYFEEPEVRTILLGLAPLLRNSKSRLWVDFVKEEAVKTPEVFPEVNAFMQGMQMLGEPFIFGPKDVHEFMKSNGFLCHEMAPSDEYHDDKSDPVYSVYGFCVASAQAAALIPSDEVISWVSHPAHPTPAPAIEPEIVPHNSEAKSIVRG